MVRPQHPIRLALVAVLAGGTITAAAAAPAAAAPAPRSTAGSGSCDTNYQVSSAVPATSYDAAFTQYGNTSGLWSGADSTYSTRLPGGRELWAFSDTLIGPVNPDGLRSPQTPFVNNSFVVTKHGDFGTVIGGTAADPKSVAAPDDPDAWYWSGDPTVSGRYLEVPYLQFHRTGTGVFDFAWQQNVLARFDAHSLRLLGVTDLPSSANIEWGSYTLQDRGWTYVYGVEDLSATKYLHIARVHGTDLRGTWQYFTGSGWSSSETDSVRVMDGVSNEISVSRLGRGYVLITQDTHELLSAHIVAYFSCSPAGPFANQTAVYTTPETGAFGSYGNGNVFTYNPHAHPEVSSGNQLLISYNVNSFDINDVFADASIYRPRFVAVTFTGPGVPRSGHIDPIQR